MFLLKYNLSTVNRPLESKIRKQKLFASKSTVRDKLNETRLALCAELKQERAPKWRRTCSFRSAAARQRCHFSAAKVESAADTAINVNPRWPIVGSLSLSESCKEKRARRTDRRPLLCQSRHYFCVVPFNLLSRTIVEPSPPPTRNKNVTANARRGKKGPLCNDRQINSWLLSFHFAVSYCLERQRLARVFIFQCAGSRTDNTPWRWNIELVYFSM
jgi:hypothetical protein